MPDDNEELETQASYRLGMPRRPDLTDEMVAWIEYRDVKVRVIWRARKHQDLLNLATSLMENDFWNQALMEYEVALGGAQIEGDLDFLLGESDVEDEDDE